MNSLQTVQTFLDHIFQGRMPQALELVAPDAVFIPSRPEPSDRVPLYGTQHGPDGAARVFTTFANVLQPQKFDIHASIDQGEHAVLYGQLHHQSLQTGRPFISDWALICKVHHGRISYYHFYEDTAALEHALDG